MSVVGNGSWVQFISKFNEALIPKQSIFLKLTLLEIHVFSSIFGLPPWNAKEFYSTTLEFSIDILNRGVTFFFLEKPNVNKELLIIFII